MIVLGLDIWELLKPALRKDVAKYYWYICFITFNSSDCSIWISFSWLFTALPVNINVYNN